MGKAGANLRRHHLRNAMMIYAINLAHSALPDNGVTKAVESATALQNVALLDASGRCRSRPARTAEGSRGLLYFRHP
jgi:hypothetical protein